MKARDLLAADSRVNEQIQDERSRYEQAARDVVKGADPDHIARVRQLDPELLRKYVGYAWDRVNSGEYKLNRPNLEEDLRKWFKEKWVRFGPDGKIRGDCARGDDSEGKPKCLPQSKAHALGKKGRASAAARKRRQDPNPERKGKAINVATKKKTNEAAQVNLNTALSLGRDLHDAVLELNELVKSGHRVGQLSQLRREIQGLHQQLQGMGYDYDPKSSRHIAPLTVDNQPSGKIREEKSQSMHVNDYLQKAEDLHARMLAASKANNIDDFERLKKERAELDAQARQGLVAEQQCPECGGPAFTNLILAEKQDACYHKVKSRYKVWPSAYASGALVQCRKKGAANWGNKSKNEDVEEDISRRGLLKGAGAAAAMAGGVGIGVGATSLMSDTIELDGKVYRKIRKATPEQLSRATVKTAPDGKQVYTWAIPDRKLAGRINYYYLPKQAGISEEVDPNNPWGDQGRFAGDVKTNISTTVTKAPLKVGQRVRVNDGRIQGAGEITKLSGDRATVWIDSYARSFEVPVKSLSAAVTESKSAISTGITKKQR